MSGPSLVQANYPSERDPRNPTANENFYLVAVRNNGELAMWWKDCTVCQWFEGEHFGSGVGESPPCMIQANHGTNTENDIGEFHVCVAVNGQVQHWIRDNSALATERPIPGHLDPVYYKESRKMRWRLANTFGSNVKHVWGMMESAYHFNIEIIVETTDGKLAHAYLDWPSMKWSGPWNIGIDAFTKQP